MYLCYSLMVNFDRVGDLSMFNVSVDGPKFSSGTHKTTRTQIGGPSLNGDEFGTSPQLGLMHHAALRGELHRASELRISGTIAVVVSQGHFGVTGDVEVGSDEEAGRLKEIGDRICDQARLVSFLVVPNQECSLSATYITAMQNVA
jgi:hypothetical protein